MHWCKIKHTMERVKWMRVDEITDSPRASTARKQRARDRRWNLTFDDTINIIRELNYFAGIEARFSSSCSHLGSWVEALSSTMQGARFAGS